MQSCPIFLKNLKKIRPCGPLLDPDGRLKCIDPLSHSCLPRQMLSEMVAPMTMEEIDFREKAWTPAKSLQVGTGQGYYPLNS